MESASRQCISAWTRYRADNQTLLVAWISDLAYVQTITFSSVELPFTIPEGDYANAAPGDFCHMIKTIATKSADLRRLAFDVLCGDVGVLKNAVNPDLVRRARLAVHEWG